MIKRLISVISRTKAFLYGNPAAYLTVIAMSVALVFAAWLFLSGEGVAFVYNEF